MRFINQNWVMKHGFQLSHACGEPCSGGGPLIKTANRFIELNQFNPRNNSLRGQITTAVRVTFCVIASRRRLDNPHSSVVCRSLFLFYWSWIELLSPLLLSSVLSIFTSSPSFRSLRRKYKPLWVLFDAAVWRCELCGSRWDIMFVNSQLTRLFSFLVAIVSRFCFSRKM